MNIIKGNDLKEYLQDKNFVDFKKRFVFADMMSEIKSHKEKLVALYGLRRTGKTTLMYQAIMELNNFDKCTFIQCSGKDTIDDLFKYLSKADSNYFFIDEITKIKDFIRFSSCLSDNFINKNRKVIMSGTDSLGFNIAASDELYDRITMLHTTYIPFYEYNYLLDKDIFTYMRYGGTLSDENAFYNEEKTNEYTNTSISKNILHTYKYWKDENETSIFDNISSSDMTSFINRIIRQEDIKFITKVLSDKFKASEISSVRQMYEVKAKTNLLLPEEEREDIPDAKIFKDESLREKIRDALLIKDEHDTDINDDLARGIKYNLLKLDVIKKQDDTFYLIQPGMRYCHIKCIIDTIKENPILKNNFPKKDIEMICEKIMQDIEGHLLENICITDLQDYYRMDIGINVNKYNPNALAGEFDIVLENKVNKKAIALEVKRSDKAIEKQKKWLNNKELCDFYNLDTGYNIVGKYVLYNGVNLTNDDNVVYKNMSDFLKAPMNNINIDFPEFNRLNTDANKDKIFEIDNNVERE